MRTGRSVVSMVVGVMLVGPALLSGGRALGVTGGGWGTAVEVPGTAALNAGDQAQLYSMSCPSSGNCAAGGWYTDASGHEQAFVVDETGGVWGNAIEVPGTAALNTGRVAQVVSVSCSSPGTCVSGGFYSAGINAEAFVVDETGGVWGKAIEVPGTAALNASGFAEVASVSCAPGAPGNCSAVGGYADTSVTHEQVFVADETGGVWGNAIEVPGTAALNALGAISADHLSCPTAGNCTLSGAYRDSAGHDQPFVAREKSGVWGKAFKLPGVAALNAGVVAGIDALSCTSPGNCAAAGRYSLGTGSARQLFVANETNGRWSPAVEMPGIAALNAGRFADADSMSCTTSGNCAAGGYYETSTGIMMPFVINETGGIWGQATAVPGLASLTEGGSAVNSVSCSSARNCVAGGYYRRQAMVASEFGGVWHNASLVPGSKALNTGFSAQVLAVSCARAGTCALGGFYSLVPKNETEVFIDTRG